MPSARADRFEHAFRCPLPNGLHARPASQLANVATRFSSEIRLTNERTSAVANAKSVLAVVAMDVRRGDGCLVEITGDDAEPAHAALREFLTNVLPTCDEHIEVGGDDGALTLPPSLQRIIGVYQTGRPICAGIGQGAVVIAQSLSLPTDLDDTPASSPDEERSKIRVAITALRSMLEGRLSAKPTGQEAGILRAHLAIAGDVGLVESIDARISKQRSAVKAVAEAGRAFAARLLAAESAYIRERAVDVEDVCLQLLEIIRGESFTAADIDLSGPSVIVADTLTPRQILSLDKRHVAALVLSHGGSTSHAVILARSFNIPTLVGVLDARTRLASASEAIVDAHLGIVIPDITPAIQRYYDREQLKHERRRERLQRFLFDPPLTIDGAKFEVAANVSTAEELAPAFQGGADGIGLFRTEMLFMDRDEPPSEDEQFSVYLQAARAAGGKPVIIRTFDVGGDKPVPYLELPQSTSAFSGYRGVRVYPQYRDLFRSQLRAIIRATAFGNVQVMAPMVGTLDEVRWVRAQIKEVQASLEREGVAFDREMRVGIMVEVPSAAFIIDQLSAEVDFFSIGTNDLMQNYLAVDRGSDEVAGLFNALHPSFLRLLYKIVQDARKNSRWVGMCGEMARNLRALPLLVGLGLDELSMAAPDIAAQKNAISQLSADECRDLLDGAMGCRSIAEVEGVIASFQGGNGTSSLLEPPFIVIDSDSASRDEAIKELIDVLFAAGRTDEPGKLEAAVWAREATYSTGLGYGFAVPHCKSDAIGANSIAVARLTEPIEWDSIDGQPVQFVIMLAMRESDVNGTHMKVFSKLARRLMNEEFRERMLAATDRKSILECLKDELGLDAG